MKVPELSYFQGLREILDISQKNSSTAKIKKVSNVNKEVQTDDRQKVGIVEQEVTVTLPMPPLPKAPPRSPKHSQNKLKIPEEKSDARESLEEVLGEVTSGETESDETGSEDESVKYDTIKKSDLRKINLEKANKDNTTASSPTPLPSTNEIINSELNDSNKADCQPMLVEKICQDTVSPSEDKKLSPSEEVVCPLVEQIVSQSVASDSTEDTNEEDDKIIAVNETAAKAGKQKGKKQSNRYSPKKTGKK